MIGTTLAHYRVLERLGAGGMGTVYRAHDERLGRDVAIKVLVTGVRRDVEREAQALARLTHPHIAAVYELGHADGVDFIVMELVAGPSLADRLERGPLPPAEAVRIGAQIAAALDEAHEHGVVHRDLKPANVRLTARGDVKVLDFGIARLFESSSAQAQELPTESVMIAGTVPYMSPEQLRGEAVDGRSDVWALGVLMHELLTGMRPFDRPTSPETMSAVLRDPPPPLPGLVPPALNRVILQCLEKDAGRRYRHAGEVRAALETSDTATSRSRVPGQVEGAGRRATIMATALFIMACAGVAVWLAIHRPGVSTSTAPVALHVGSLAVLPLENLSGDASQDYFADGMTEALTLELSKLAALRVTSRRSAMRFRTTSKPLPEIARELGVDALIEGSVIRSGNRARVSVELIQAATDRHLWAERYDRDLGNVLAMQSDVARDIATHIQLELSPVERARLSGARRVDPAAYDAFLRAREQLTRANRSRHRAGDRRVSRGPGRGHIVCTGVGRSLGRVLRDDALGRRRPRLPGYTAPSGPGSSPGHRSQPARRTAGAGATAQQPRLELGGGGAGVQARPGAQPELCRRL
jgi:eukaryotic-like serine/threonine-protein kinase